MAEGLPAETYLDVGNHTDFAGTSALTLHPTFAAMAHELACRRFVVAGPEVEAARAALAERADVVEAEAVAQRRAG